MLRRAKLLCWIAVLFLFAAVCWLISAVGQWRDTRTAATALIFGFVSLLASGGLLCVSSALVALTGREGKDRQGVSGSTSEVEMRKDSTDRHIGLSMMNSDTCSRCGLDRNQHPVEWRDYDS